MGGGKLNPNRTTVTESWSEQERKQFSDLSLHHGKNFRLIAKKMQTKSVRQCVSFYFFWKKVWKMW